MSVYLVLTEKPSVAGDIAKALGKAKKCEGYLEVEWEANRYLITWAYGHLFEIDNSIAPQKWEWETLPILPDRFKYSLIKNTAKQFKTIKQLLDKVDAVIIATDAGREGELIARLILKHAGWKGHTYRLWTSEALSPAVVRRELHNLHISTEFDSLFQEALARQHADWIVGINLTRAVSLQAGKGVWSIGRVQTPVLKLLVERHLERQNFKKEEYYIVKALFEKDSQAFWAFLHSPKKEAKSEKGEVDATDKDESEIRLKKEDAERIVNAVKEAGSGTVVKVERKIKKEPPPLLHSLTSLQREANKLYGFSAQKTLNIAQKLYETYKCLSYPRTDARHLDETPQTKTLVKKVLKTLGHDDLIPAVDKAGKRVFDNSKLTDHYALIPLKPLPENASEDEKKIYNLVKCKFIGAFMPFHEYETTTVLIKVKDYLFKATGKRIIEVGWRSLYRDEKDKLLPSLGQGEKLPVKDARAEQKFTQPPPAHTEASILKRMEKLGLGTPATRAGILETLKARNYVEKKGKTLEPTPKGIEIISHIADRPFASPQMTGEWERKLAAIRKGQNSYSDFLTGIKQFTKEQIEAIKNMKINTAHLQKVIGTCSCGGTIKVFNKVYKCERCGKYLFKTVFGKRLSEKQAIALMQDKEVKLSGLKSKKSGKRYSANAVLKQDGEKWAVKLVF